jgi:hypothetical protein
MLKIKLAGLCKYKQLTILWIEKVTQFMITTSQKSLEKILCCYQPKAEGAKYVKIFNVEQNVLPNPIFAGITKIEFYSTDEVDHHRVGY